MGDSLSLIPIMVCKLIICICKLGIYDSLPYIVSIYLAFYPDHAYLSGWSVAAFNFEELNDKSNSLKSNKYLCINSASSTAVN